jgi:hypothetical protein
MRWRNTRFREDVEEKFALSTDTWVNLKLNWLSTFIAHTLALHTHTHAHTHTPNTGTSHRHAHTKHASELCGYVCKCITIGKNKNCSFGAMDIYIFTASWLWLASQRCSHNCIYIWYKHPHLPLILSQLAQVQPWIIQKLLITYSFIFVLFCLFQGGKISSLDNLLMHVIRTHNTS